MFSFVIFSEECANPLGMESGLIEDNQLSASSSHDKDTTGPQNSRLFHKLFFINNAFSILYSLPYKYCKLFELNSIKLNFSSE